MRRHGVLTGCLVTLALMTPTPAWTAEVVPPEIEQPGTQPSEISNLESPDKCDNCHGGYNTAVEPAHNWRGSMMANAGRDPIFWATVAIAEQDFDGAGDLCIRCHSTGGWLAGRSTPTEGSGLAAGDADGVECDYCHKLTNPDDSEHLGFMLHPFVANEPGTDAHDWDDPDGSEGYYGSGMSSMWPGNDKLGPYNDAEARHQFMLSLFHRDRDFCGTCHDVSNPAVGELAHNHGSLELMSGTVQTGTGAPRDMVAFNNPPYRYGVVERTFSEYKSAQIARTRVDDYPGLPAELKGGALQQIWEVATANGTRSADYDNPPAPRYYSCQTCHMRPVTGTGANKRGVPVRDDLPLHDMTGGNYWMADVIAYLDSQDKLRLGGGLSAGQLDAMSDGAIRAREQLELAATLSVNEQNDTVTIVNHTGHKLISGYPEGRRMWLRIEWYDANQNLLREDGAYGEIEDANGLPVVVNGVAVKSLLEPDDPNTRVYEAHLGVTLEWAQQLNNPATAGLPLAFDRTRLTTSTATTLTLGDFAAQTEVAAVETFHFVLNNTVIKDNRIPPYGMSYDLAAERNALPIPADQYGGVPGGVYEHFDTVTLNPPASAVAAEIHLMYQPTSWEYIQFLWLANDGSVAFLADEGVNMLEAWLATGMAEPIAMAEAEWGSEVSGCEAPIPQLLSAEPGHTEVSLTWTGFPADDGVLGYRTYYDQAQKGQHITDLPCAEANHSDCTSYIDTGLSNGQNYCYKVTSYEAECESEFSNILCATPTQPGQDVLLGAGNLQTGRWVRIGKGKNAETVFESTTSFAAGDGVVIRAQVLDENGVAVANATVTYAIVGPESHSLGSNASNANGLTEATWQTQRPRKKGGGGTSPGAYTITVTGVDAEGYTWDGVQASVQISLQ